MATANIIAAMKAKSPGSVLTAFAPKTPHIASVGTLPKAPGIPIPKQKISVAPPPAPVAAGPELAPVQDEKLELVSEGTAPVSTSASPSLPKSLPTQNGAGMIKAAAKSKEKEKQSGGSKKRSKGEEEEEEESGSEEEEDEDEEESGSEEEEDAGEDSSSSSSSSSSSEEEEAKEKKASSKKPKAKSQEKPKAKKDTTEKKEETKKASKKPKTASSDDKPQAQVRYPFTIEKTPAIPAEFSRKMLSERPKVTDAHHAMHEKYENIHHSYYADMEVAGYKMFHSMDMRPESLKRRADAFAEAEKLEIDKNKQHSSSADGVPASKKNDSQIAVTTYVKKLSATRWLDFDGWYHEGRNQAVLASDFRVKEHLEQNPQLDGPEAYRKVRFILGRVLSRAACGVPQKPAGRSPNKGNIVYNTSTIFTQKSFSGESGKSPDNRKWVPDILYTKEQIAREEAASAEYSEEEKQPEKEAEKPKTKKNKAKGERVEEAQSKKPGKKARTEEPKPAVQQHSADPHPPPAVVPMAIVVAPPTAAAAASVSPILSATPEVAPILKQLLDGQAMLIQQNGVIIAQNEAVKALFAQLYAKNMFSDQ
jgi:hypothetical protein